MFSSLRKVIRQNLYFFIPFLLWILAGICCLLLYSKSELFFAVNSLHTPFLDRLNTFFSAYGRGDVIPLVLTSLLLMPAYRNRNYIATTLSFGLLLPTVIYVSKLYFNAPRPLKFFEGHDVHTVPWLDNLYQHSFPSGHTFGAFGFFLLLSLYLPMHHKAWSLLFFILALACGYSRMYLGQHFFADVYAGSIAGTLITLFIYLAGQKIFRPQADQKLRSHA